MNLNFYYFLDMNQLVSFMNFSLILKGIIKKNFQHLGHEINELVNNR